jgi:hypothetical protein
MIVGAWPVIYKSLCTESDDNERMVMGDGGEVNAAAIDGYRNDGKRTAGECLGN